MRGRGVEACIRLRTACVFSPLPGRTPGEFDRNVQFLEENANQAEELLPISTF
jgi:hypothetical protein